MSELIEMTAIAKGTIVGASGIIHVDPANDGEGGRYSHPRVSEADAVQLERRKLAVRTDRATVPESVDLVTEEGRIPLPAQGQVAVGDPDMPPAAPALAAPVADVAAPASAPAPAVVSGQIETGLDAGDPDMPPAAPAAPVAAQAASRKPRSDRKST